MLRLSVNVNKVATLRNARGGDLPSLHRAVEVIVAQGCSSITVHPRADQRHIRPEDARAISQQLQQIRQASPASAPALEFNIEGDPRPEWLDLVRELRPTQATLVPVTPGEITSQAGWPSSTDPKALTQIIDSFRALGIRSSLFVEARVEAVQWAHRCGADRVELYTEPYARAFATAQPEAITRALEPYKQAAQRASELGLGVNAGHDLDLQNLPAFVALAEAPYGLQEVSIGHALISEALFDGLAAVVRRYLAVVEGAS